jgi:hypothetical protein
MATCSYALQAWAPTYITRRFHWSPAEYGPILSAVSLGAAAMLVFNGRAVDWLYGRGTKDAAVRYYSWLLMGAIPVATVAFLIPNPILFMICYGIIQVVALPTVVFMAAAIQLIAPANLRGQITSVFLFCITVLGGSFGPLAVGTITDFVFHNDKMVGYSIAIVLCVMMPLALTLLRFSLTPLREAVLAIERRNAATS